ncbi:helix-turn-helix transcriptional regulator [Occultella gossypii]|uniref:Helix-turn-helix domain-containing protein n=1 Tax=Occultella gossypii TaxID=2800820 RepID=A0ABS7SF45_9MICO|nr:helix-turn-helix transcriptional regulator [Occultella gossypii]MBZ2198369.1 helix-turn-helix domain-containing protein [Occultella gossypii]
MNRNELAALLRRARERVRPEDVGLPAGSRRRVPGLRREEVAQLAGLSVEYIVRLEQGRGPHPSTQVLQALSRALRLPDPERDQLYVLADAAPPRPGQIQMTVRPGLLRLLDRLTDLPGLVLSAKSDVLAWNPMATALLGDLSRWPDRERNIIWQRFMGAEAGRVAMAPEELEAVKVTSVATLRTAMARYPEDLPLHRLIKGLRRGSAEFERLWGEGHTCDWQSLTTTVDHPDLGRIVLDSDTVSMPCADQSMVIYSATPGTPAAQALALLRVTGSQDLAPTGASYGTH